MEAGFGGVIERQGGVDEGAADLVSLGERRV